MRGWLLLAFVVAGPAARADVELFPKQALQPAARPDSPARADNPARADTIELQPDSPWRSVELKAHGLFAPTIAQVTDESPPQLLARQLARRREPAPHPPERGRDDSRINPAEPAALHLAREEQVDAAQAAYEEPAVWQRAEIEVRLDDGGAPLTVKLVRGSGRPALDAAALDAVRRAVGAVSGLDARGPLTARFRVEAGAGVAMPARTITYPTQTRPSKGVMVPVVRGRFGGARTEVQAPLQPRVQTRVQLISLTGQAAR
jgi:TonB family protein